MNNYSIYVTQPKFTEFGDRLKDKFNGYTGKFGSDFMKTQSLDIVDKERVQFLDKAASV